MKYTGRISISRITGGDEDKIHIEIRENRSGVQFLDIEMGVAEFGYAVTGLSGQNCKFELRQLEHVGKLRECKQVCVPFEVCYANEPERSRLAKKALAPYEVDGWSGYKDDLFNMHRHTKDGFNVTFVRFVDQPTTK